MIHERQSANGPERIGLVIDVEMNNVGNGSGDQESDY